MTEGHIWTEINVTLTFNRKSNILPNIIIYCISPWGSGFYKNEVTYLIYVLGQIILFIVCSICIRTCWSVSCKGEASVTLTFDQIRSNNCVVIQLYWGTFTVCLYAQKVNFYLLHILYVYVLEQGRAPLVKSMWPWPLNR